MTPRGSRRRTVAAADLPSDVKHKETRAVRRGPTNRLSPRWRKVMLTIHVISSVGLLGADCAILALVIAGALGSNPVTVYPAAHLLSTVLIVPLALAALLSGVLQGLLTRWGLFQHWWIFIKLVLTVGGTVFVFVLVPALDAAASMAAAGQVQSDPFALVKDSSGASGVLILTVILSVFKPFGRTFSKNHK